MDIPGSRETLYRDILIVGKFYYLVCRRGIASFVFDPSFKRHHNSDICRIGCRGGNFGQLQIGAGGK